MEFFLNFLCLFLGMKCAFALTLKRKVCRRDGYGKREGPFWGKDEAGRAREGGHLFCREGPGGDREAEGGGKEDQELICPKCLGKLESYTFIGFFLDRCQACGGVWLDKGELEGILGEASRSRVGSFIERFLAKYQREERR